MAGDFELSERELEILKLLSTGASNKEIAQQLVISPNTVKVHLRNIFSKIGVVSRTEATLYALKIGLVNPQGVNQPETPEAEQEPPAQPVPWYGKPVTRNVLILAAMLILAGVMFLIIQANKPTQDSNSAFNTTLNRWSTLAAMPEGRTEMAIERYDNFIFLISGKNDQGMTGAVLAYDGLQNKWSTRARKPIPVIDAKAVLIGERIYVPGGMTADGTISGLLEIYNPRNDVWSTGADLPVPVSQYALAAFEGRLYLFGGWDGRHYLAKAWVYDPNEDNWRPLKDMPTPLGKAAAATSGSKIYLVGGTDGDKVFSTVRVYYPDREQSGDDLWEDKPALPEGREGLEATTLADTIYISGGYGADSQPLPGVLRFNEAANTWEQVDASPEPISPGAALIGFNNNLHLFGGAENGVPTAEHQSYQAIYTVQLPAVSN